jgi:hypothetical protein
MNHLLIATAILTVFFIAGMLVMRKHAARIEAAALDFKTQAQRASDSIKSDATKVTAIVSSAHYGMVKASADIKAAINK